VCKFPDLWDEPGALQVVLVVPVLVVLSSTSCTTENACAVKRTFFWGSTTSRGTKYQVGRMRAQSRIYRTTPTAELEIMVEDRRGST
jgi:hypothetical protein